MREIFRHTPGRIFLIVLLLSFIGILWVPKYFFKPHIFFGWLPLPFLAGIIFILVCLGAFQICHCCLLVSYFAFEAQAAQRPMTSSTVR